MTTTSASLHGVYKALLNGVHEHGEGGVLYVKGNACAYRFPLGFAPPRFREALEEALAERGHDHFFVVEERDAQLHVLAYPKAVVRAAVAEAVVGGGCRPATADKEAEPRIVEEATAQPARRVDDDGASSDAVEEASKK
jgi:hypothetical protein